MKSTSYIPTRIVFFFLFIISFYFLHIDEISSFPTRFLFAFFFSRFRFCNSLCSNKRACKRVCVCVRLCVHCGHIRVYTERMLTENKPFMDTSDILTIGRRHASVKNKKK